MVKKRIEKKHAKIAMYAALHRALANKKYNNLKYGPDYLAEHFLSSILRFLIKFDFIRNKIKNKLDKNLPGLNEYLIARTSFFDDIFVHSMNRDVSQIVILGAGYDSRAFRFDWLNTKCKVFELDLAKTQKRKKRCLKRAGAKYSDNITLLPINFNQESLKNVLEKFGFEFNKKTIFIWEGVSYYLESESVNSTLETIGNLSHKESIIAFDYMAKIPKENMKNYYGVDKFHDTMNEQHANETLKLTFESDKLRSYLKKRGMNVIDHLDNNDIESEYLSNDDGTSIGQITGHFRFAVATPR